jgi:hypothetical protein
VKNNTKTDFTGTKSEDMDSNTFKKNHMEWCLNGKGISCPADEVQ